MPSVRPGSARCRAPPIRRDPRERERGAGSRAPRREQAAEPRAGRATCNPPTSPSTTPEERTERHARAAAERVAARDANAACYEDADHSTFGEIESRVRRQRVARDPMIVEQMNHAISAPAMPLTAAAYAPGERTAREPGFTARARLCMCSSIALRGDAELLRRRVVSRSRPPHTTESCVLAVPRDHYARAAKLLENLSHLRAVRSSRSSSVNSRSLQPAPVVNSTAYAAIVVGQGAMRLDGAASTAAPRDAAVPLREITTSKLRCLASLIGRHTPASPTSHTSSPPNRSS